MQSITLIVLIAAAVLLLGAGVFAAVRRSRLQRSQRLREHFGPEYDRLLAQHGDRAAAERELLARQKRRAGLDIHVLTEEQCDTFSAEWGRVQQLFLDDPHGAAVAADAVVKEVMLARGYPTGDFDQRVADLSVEHARVVEHYRAARKLAAGERGPAQTEELRQSLIHFRALFTDLLQTEHTPQRAPLVVAAA